MSTCISAVMTPYHKFGYYSFALSLIISVDQMKKMESDYACEVLHFLLRERHGTPLVKLPVDLVDKDNEASLVLLCALFKHCKYYEYWCIPIFLMRRLLDSFLDSYIYSQLGRAK